MSCFELKSENENQTSGRPGEKLRVKKRTAEKNLKFFCETEWVEVQNLNWLRWDNITIARALNRPSTNVSFAFGIA